MISDDDDAVYILERVDDDNAGVMWIIACINPETGRYNLCYCNKMQGSSLKPPHRYWQAVNGAQPPPKSAGPALEKFQRRALLAETMNTMKSIPKILSWSLIQDLRFIHGNYKERGHSHGALLTSVL